MKLFNSMSFKSSIVFLLVALLIVIVISMTIRILAYRQQSFKYLDVQAETLFDPVISKSIAVGLAQKKIFIDNHHASIPPNPYIFDSFKISYEIGQLSLTDEQNKLFGCGLLLMNYAIGKPEFSDAECRVIKKFMVNGGRIMLLCPIWVWESYDKKSLSQSPYYRIAQYYGLELSSLYVDPPFSVNLKFVNKDQQDFIGNIKGVFSSINRKEDFVPIISGKDNRIAAVFAYRYNSRIFIWSHNNLFNNEIAISASGRKFIGKIFEEMFDVSNNLLEK